MNRIILTLFLSLITLGLYSNNSQAQVSSILVNGKIVDTFTYDNVSGTSISAIRSSDSILVAHTRCDDDGDFSLAVQEPGDYIILYSHNTFAQFVDERNIPADGLSLGEVYLYPKSTLLQEVVIEESRAITIKGDTVEYNADSFKVREFDNVEELLRKLPGIEVDASGNITAHGEKVQKMLVDGDEFFSDDPVVLSKMLRASAVSTVQVFNDKSEQAKFTGVDDGVQEKTINLKLKDDAKRGMFGKLEIGGGLPDYWENSGILNVFNNKQKIALYGVMSNTNKTGLGWNDMRGMGDNSMEFTDDGMMVTSNTSDEFSNWNGEFSGRGLPKTWNTGIHFSDKMGENNNHELTADYRFNKNNIFTVSDDIYEYLDTQFVNTSHSETRRSQISNIFNSKYKWEIDSTQNIQVRARGSYNLFNSDYSVNSNSRNPLTNEIFNDNNSSTKSEGVRFGGNVDILYRKKLAKKGRTISTQAVINYNESQSESDFNSMSNYYLLGVHQIYNQLKTDSSQHVGGKVTVTYTEPLIDDKLSLVSNASYSLNNRLTKNFSYDRVGEALVLNDTFTNSFEYNVGIVSAGTSISYNAEKYHVSAGGNVSYSDFFQKNLRTDVLSKLNFFNFNPSVSFRTKDNRNFDFRATYNGNTRQPDINQLQPITQNTDPLNLRVGNMDLEQEFNHSLNFNIGKYKVLQQRFFYSGGGVNFRSNAISTDQYLRNDGVRVYTYYNSAGNWNGYIYSGYSFKPKGWQPRLNFNMNANYNRALSKLNYIEGANTNFSISPSIGIDWSKDTVIIFDYSVSGSYNISNSNITSIQNNFLSTNQRFNVSYRFGKGFTLGTDVNWTIREKIDVQDNNNNLFIWNAYLSKTFLKDQSLVVKVYGNDLLNQNVGFNRWISNNIVTQSLNNNIRRYGMLSIAWNFTKSKSLSSDNSLKEDTEMIQEADSDPDIYIETE